MTPAEMRGILGQVTEDLLAEMRRDGFYTYEVGTGKRYDPIVWDINNGYCAQWAGRAAEMIEGAVPTWVGDDHCVLVYDGRFYDADCLDGVDDVDDLPMFADPLGDRPEP